MKKTILATALLTATVFNSEAQQMLGISTSNWCGTNSIDLNPSSIADSRTRFALDLFSFNLGFDNNLGSIRLANALKSTDGVPKLGDIFSISKNKDFNVLLPVANIHLPGIMVSIDNKNSVAITSAVRGSNQFNHFDQTLLQSVMDPGAVSNDIGIHSTNFNWTAHLWTELKLTYAREVYNEGEHYVKAGISLTRLGGIGYLSLKGKNLDGTYYKAQDSIHTNSTDIEFASNLLDNASGLSSGLSDVFGQFFGKKGGSGFGGDLGATYEYRPAETNSDDQSSNKYKIRGSIAVTDLGAIKYTNSMEAKITASGSMSAADFAKNIGNFGSFSSYAKTHGYTLDTSKGSTKVHMPTALVVAADYYVAQHFYVNATWIKNLANRMNYGNSIYGQVTITPRWDTRYFCVALPLTYSSMSQSMKAGLGFRAGGLIFGSDDMLAFMGGKAYGMNFYVGGYIPINKKHKKSHDGAMGGATKS